MAPVTVRRVHCARRDRGRIALPAPVGAAHPMSLAHVGRAVAGGGVLAAGVRAVRLPALMPAAKTATATAAIMHGAPPNSCAGL
jgi:hypothetical protein